MDQTKLQETIAEFYAKLPPEAQDFFANMKWMDILNDISVMHNLNPVQIETLGAETTLVLLGIIHGDEYEELLMKELGLPKELTEKIISEIQEKILTRMRPTLEVAYAQNVNDMGSLAQDEGDEKLDPRLSLLPKNVRDAITHSDYQKKLYAIGTKHKLQISQMASLEEVTMKFITGAISPTKYENDVALETELPAAAVKEIAQEVNDTILVSIREYMQEQERKQNPVRSETSADDEVPIPPYASASIKQEPVVTSPIVVPPAIREVKPIIHEPRVISESVISNIKEPQPTMGPMSGNDQGILAHAGIEIVDSVQPITAKTPSLIENKLFAPTKSQAVTSDHSLPKISNTSPVETNTKPPISVVLPKAKDPYHEEI